jgi:hypothetical protein
MFEQAFKNIDDVAGLPSILSPFSVDIFCSRQGGDKKI